MHTQTIIKSHRNPLSHAGAGGLGWRSHASCKKTLTSDNVHSRVVCGVFHFPFKVIVRGNISFSDTQCNKKPAHCPLHSTWEICPCPKHPEPTLGRYFLMTVWESKAKWWQELAFSALLAQLYVKLKDTTLKQKVLIACSHPDVLFTLHETCNPEYHENRSWSGWSREQTC